MQLIILFIFISLPFELIHILMAKNKFGRYVLPTISYILSLMNILSLIIYNVYQDQKYGNSVGNGFIKELPSYIMILIIFNIPTILFCVTNILIKKQNKQKIS